MLSNLIPLPTVTAPKLRKPPLVLSLYENVKLSQNTLIKRVTKELIGSWRRSIRSVGGYWIGEATYDGPAGEMEDIFRDGLMWEIRETFGGMITWQGFLASMKYTKSGIEYQRSWADLANKVMVKYSTKSYNMISNGSFEEATLPVSVGTPATVEAVTSWRTDGKKSLHVVTNNQNEGVYLLQNATMYQGNTYNMSLDVKWVSGMWLLSVYRTDTMESIGLNIVREKKVKTLKIEIDPDKSQDCTFSITFTCLTASGNIYMDAASFILEETEAKTGWFEDTESEGIYGEVEDILTRDGMSDDAAEYLAQTELVKRAYGRIMPPGNLDMSRLDTEQKDRLDLVFYGYAFTLRNLYSAQNDEDGTASTCTSVVNAEVADSEFITAGEIETNATDYYSNSLSDRKRQWDILSEIVDIGDDGFNRWEIGVGANRQLYYRQAPETLKGKIKKGEAKDLVGSRLDPWLAEPGYYLLEDAPVGGAHISGRLADDQRVAYLDEIEFSAQDWAEGKSGITFNRTSSG